LKNFVEGVVVVKVLAAPLGPEVVENEGAEDVKKLLEVGETAGVVSVEAGRSSSRSMEASSSKMNGQLMVMSWGPSIPPRLS